jgi:cytochrome c peroxidase
MRFIFRTLILVGVTAAPVLFGQTAPSYTTSNPWWQAGQGTLLPHTEDWENATGQVRLQNQSGDFQTANHAFFTALGSNGRACVTCHQPSSSMSLATVLVQQRWTDTQGQDPIFAAVDGSNCPSLPQPQMGSHSLLLNRGLIRIALPWPPVAPDGTTVTPEFQIQVVNDPTGCNLSSVYGLNSQQPMISVYRRPRVVANVQYISGPDGMYLLADGRESSLQSQAMSAALVHEQAATPLTPDQLQQIVDFEMQAFTAQNWDTQGGMLDQAGNPPVLGVNNMAIGADGTATVPVTPDAFTAWLTETGLAQRQQAFRQSAARGSDLFFNRQFQLPSGMMGTCATCHQPGTSQWIDSGTTNLPTAKSSPELPLFLITCNSDAPPHPTLGSVISTQDPGRALITGRCADVGSIGTQQFRGLEARAPYFSNGSAASLEEVVDFYDQRFGIGFTDQEKQDLVNLLSIM